MTSIVLDIESIPTCEKSVIDEIAAGILPPGNISKAETIAAWHAEKKPLLIDEAVRRTSFDGTYGRIIVFGMAVDDADPEVFCSAFEPDLLKQISAINVAPSPNIIGHNVSWDIRFLWQRFAVNDIPAPQWLRAAITAKPWDLSDTMLMWNPDREKRISLDKLCRILGIPSSKGKMDGSMVYEYFLAGKLEEIAAYCAGDVAATREVYRRLA